MTASKSPETLVNVEEFCSRAIRALDRPPGTDPAMVAGATGGSTTKGGSGGGGAKGEGFERTCTTRYCGPTLPEDAFFRILAAKKK